MKRMLAILLTTAMLLGTTALAMAEDTTADTTASATMAPQGGQGGVQDGRVSGTITAIGDGSITIDIRMGGQPPAGDPPQGDGNGKQGDASQGNPPQGNDQGNAPQGGPGGNGGNNGGGPGGNGSAPQGGGKGGKGNGDGNAPQQPTSDNGQASQSLTISVTSATTIQNGDTTLALSDLSVGMAVSVTVTGDDASGYTATAITTMAAPAQDDAAAADTEAAAS